VWEAFCRGRETHQSQVPKQILVRSTHPTSTVTDRPGFRPGSPDNLWSGWRSHKRFEPGVAGSPGPWAPCLLSLRDPDNKLSGAPDVTFCDRSSSANSRRPSVTVELRCCRRDCDRRSAGGSLPSGSDPPPTPSPPRRRNSAPPRSPVLPATTDHLPVPPGSDGLRTQTARSGRSGTSKPGSSTNEAATQLPEAVPCREPRRQAAGLHRPVKKGKPLDAAPRVALTIMNSDNSLSALSGICR
jgi:hypothetical protein